MRRFFGNRPSVLDEPIAKILTEMNIYGSETEEYRIAIDNLERLMKMKAEEARDGISPDTMAIVLGNLLGIGIIVSYERMHAVVSKGMGLILRTK